MSLFLLAKEGRAGDLRLGDTLEEITMHFGEPDDSLASDPTALIKYGDFELIFHNGMLTIVHCEFGATPFPKCPDGARLGIDMGGITWPVDLQVLTSKAKEAGLLTEVTETEYSTAASFGGANLEIHHAEQVATLSVLNRPHLSS